MQDKRTSDAEPTSFGDFLRSRRLRFLIILIFAFTLRIVLVTVLPLPAGDTPRYEVPAINILDGNGFSSDTHPPFRPSEAAAPGYPIFIAVVYAVFGRHQYAVRVVQCLIDTSTGLLIAFIAFHLAPASLKKYAAISSLIVYSFFSWFTFIWTAYILTETLIIFLTVSVITLCIVAMRKGTRFWFYAGLTCGLALLVRPDSVLLAAAVILFLIYYLIRQKTWTSALSIITFCFAIAIMLTPWTIRNYLSLGKIEPLASEYGFAQPSYMPTGYLHWLRTWIIDETYFPNIFPPAFNPSESVFFDPAGLPDSAFDSLEERQRVTSQIARFNQNHYFVPDMDAEFRELASARIRRAPARFFLVLPIQRTSSMWLTGFSTNNPLSRMLRMLAVIPILVGGLLGFAIWCRHEPLAVLLLSIILLRTLFFAYHYAPESRYIVEAYPPVIAACGAAVATIWLKARHFGARFIKARRENAFQDSVS